MKCNTHNIFFSFNNHNWAQISKQHMEFKIQLAVKLKVIQKVHSSTGDVRH